ncbi:MAG: DNA recombination protein RmuC [Flavobacteriales bacterium]|nr:MAG: DNA recombination protein RmuC [Flavobacteriales bacterium]
MDLMGILLLVIGLVAGFFIGFLFKKTNMAASSSEENNDENLKIEIATLKTRLDSATQNYKEQKETIEKLFSEKNGLLSENAQIKEANQNLETKLKEHKAEVDQLQKKFSLEFENIANKLLKQNTTDFAEANQKRLSEILNPLKENIKSFEQKVEEKYVKEVKERSALMTEVKTLSELNQQMREDAQNLTRALKGDSKAQGNWGELILEKILESSGLVKGEEYKTEDYYTNQDGGGSRLDVIIKLPDDKQIIIDSKVSITAYTNYVNSEDEDEKATHIKAHLTSVKSHIDILSKKDYSQIPGLNTPDFVLMFMPSEPSFSFTLQNDSNIYNYAWDKKIVIVSPTTLLATLKTVASVWKQERQTKNALEIARQSGALYDKFVGFIADLEKIDKGLKTSQEAYNGAVNKLKTGSGNLIGRAEKIRVLGAKTSKQIDAKYLEEKNNEIEE